MSLLADFFYLDDLIKHNGANNLNYPNVTEINDVIYDESNEYGMILRAKGIVMAEDGKWLHFDYVPGEPDIRFGTAAVIGRLCVIGSGIDKDKIKELIGV